MTTTIDSFAAHVSDVTIEHHTDDGDQVTRYYIRAVIPDYYGYRIATPTVDYTLYIFRGTRPDGRGGNTPYLGAEGAVDWYHAAELNRTWVIDGAPYREGWQTDGDLRVQMIVRASRVALADGAPRDLVLREAACSLPDCHPDQPAAVRRKFAALRERAIAAITA